MPRYMFLIKADAQAENMEAPPPDMYAEMTTFNEELNAAGVLLGGEGFRPTSHDSFRVRFSTDAGVAPTVTPGPFDLDKEDHVCGFWILRTKDAEEALYWAKKIPFRGGELVVRRIAETTVEDLGETLTEEVKEREKKIAADVANRLKE